MTDDLLASIKAALAAATPGPWRSGPLEGGWRLVEDRNGYRFAQVDDDGNRRLIANAPTWLAALVERCEAAEARLARLRDVLTWSESQCPGKCRGVIVDALAQDAEDMMAGAHVRKGEP